MLQKLYYYHHVVCRLGLRLVALGTPYPTLRYAAVGSWRFSRRTGVRYGGRDVPFPSRTRQIKHVPGRALRLARSCLASGGLSSAPSQREEEKRDKELATSSSYPSPPWSSIRRRPELLPELELTGAGPHLSLGSPARRSSRRGAAVHPAPCSLPRVAVGGSPEIPLPACSTRRSPARASAGRGRVRDEMRRGRGCAGGRMHRRTGRILRRPIGGREGGCYSCRTRGRRRHVGEESVVVSSCRPVWGGAAASSRLACGGSRGGRRILAPRLRREGAPWEGRGAGELVVASTGVAGGGVRPRCNTGKQREVGLPAPRRVLLQRRRPALLLHLVPCSRRRRPALLCRGTERRLGRGREWEGREEYDAWGPKLFVGME
jgi:hypothetical protein